MVGVLLACNFPDREGQGYMLKKKFNTLAYTRFEIECRYYIGK
jgi:hypothetical protein